MLMAIQRACILTEWIHFWPHFRCQTRFRYERQGAVISGLWRLTDTLHFLETWISSLGCQTWTIWHPQRPAKTRIPSEPLQKARDVSNVIYSTPTTLHIPSSMVSVLPYPTPCTIPLPMLPQSGLHASLTESPPLVHQHVPQISDTSLGSSKIDLLNSPLEDMRTILGSACRLGNEEAIVDGNGNTYALSAIRLVGSIGGHSVVQALETKCHLYLSLGSTSVHSISRWITMTTSHSHFRGFWRSPTIRGWSTALLHIFSAVSRWLLPLYWERP